MVLSASAAAAAADPSNPFFQSWDGPNGAPPFDRIRPEHFAPAFARAMAQHAQSVAQVVADARTPDFENTVAALERAYAPLARVDDVFGALCGAHTSEALQAVERDMAPKLARHFNEYFLNAPLFARLKALEASRASLSLTPEQARTLDRYLINFRRAGADLSGQARARYAAIMERLAELSTQFGQNVLADEASYVLPLEGEQDLAGLPQALRDAAAGAAKERCVAASHAVTLSRSSVEPFLTFSARRDLREKAWRAWIARGESGGATDNGALMRETVALRAEAAQLMGFKTHADYVLADRMAKTPAAARRLMEEVWAPARARAREEAAELQEMIRAEGGNFALEPWDWRYYAEKVRQAKYDVDEGEVKQYLALDRMIEAQFWVANRLFGLSFAERTDLPVYHPDVRVWDVTDKAGRHVAVFYGDYFARPSKRSGAWMTSYRSQSRIDGEVRPLVTNVCNFAKPAPGEPALLSLDDARTLFHEFGHGLHGMLSDVTYPLLSGTNVATDFVELPSQIYEHWLLQPEVLTRFARHAKTGAPMPQDLIGRILRARTFHQGFATVEFLGSAFVDMDVHALEKADGVDMAAFEKTALEAIGMPREIVMRHRSPHFQHIFAGGYSAGYYSYLWSAVLDTDGFDAFAEAGDVFAPGVAEKLKTFIYSAGNTREADEAYRLFRGRDPKVEPLLRHRGFSPAET